MPTMICDCEVTGPILSAEQSIFHTRTVKYSIYIITIRPLQLVIMFLVASFSENMKFQKYIEKFLYQIFEKELHIGLQQVY